MISPLSLSPGNFLLDPRTNEWVEIDNVYANGFVNVHDGEGISLADLAPITLTTDILERCGFEFEDVAEDGAIMLKCGDNMCLTWNKNTGSVWIGEHDTQVKTLHALQQLYRALSQKDLTIATIQST